MKTTKFKPSEVGPIPEEWEVKAICDIAPLQRGFDLPSSKLRDGNVPVVYSNGIGAYHDTGMCVAPALVTGRSGTVGKFTYIREGAYWPHNTALWVTSFCGNSPLYVKYLFETLDFEAFSTGTGVPTLNRNSVHDHKVAIPPRAEQEKIAEALSDVDGLLAAITKLIEKKRAIKQGAMQQLLTSKKRLAGFTGKWVEKRFDECFDLVGNNTFAREFMCEDTHGIANIHYGDVLIRYGSVLDCSRTAVPSLLDSVACKTELLKEGDVIIADTAEDETVGKAIEIRGLKDRCAVAGLHTIACRPRFVFAAGWLGYYINSSAFHDQLLPLITGTKVSSISKAGLRTTVLHVPDLIEQQAIAAVLSDMDAEIAALEAKRAKYESIKQGMMQELLTGKTRLM